MAPRWLFVLLCVVAIVGCAESQSSSEVETTKQRNAATESQDSVDSSTHVTALTVLEEVLPESSTTPVAMDQSVDSPLVNDSSPAQTERASETDNRETEESKTLDSAISQTQSTFNRLMTRIHQAIDQERWEEAEHLLNETLKLNPNSDAAQELVDLVATQLELRHQRELAGNFASAMQREEWIEATEIAVNMRTQDSALLEQIQRAKTLIESEQLADRLVANPERLSRPSVQTEVSRLRNLIADVDPGQRVGDKLARLNEMSRRWTTPVKISLSSDGYTTVILRPGKSLGRFRTQTVQLMPGAYELIGRRDGFREVRRSLLLNPNSETSTVEIKASERF